ncbi:hypothetical protein O1C46_000769 [Vibrio cholerae]|nr:hypothetical protein [Vibrio cholerae]EKF9668136.1 hypothetical protein [Vibrio cholerae]
MSDEMKMSDVEKNIRASAVMDFVDMIRGAYDSGFIDNHPTNYDIYRSAQMHVKDRYGVETDNWDDELAKESRNDNHDRLVGEKKQLQEALEQAKAMSIESINREDLVILISTGFRHAEIKGSFEIDDLYAAFDSMVYKRKKLLSELGGE